MVQNADLSFSYKPKIIKTTTEEKEGEADKSKGRGVAVGVLSEKAYLKTLTELERMVNA